MPGIYQHIMSNHIFCVYYNYLNICGICLAQSKAISFICFTAVFVPLQLDRITGTSTKPQKKTLKPTEDGNIATNTANTFVHNLLEKEVKALFEKMLVISRTSCAYEINNQFI